MFSICQCMDLSLPKAWKCSLFRVLERYWCFSHFFFIKSLFLVKKTMWIWTQHNQMWFYCQKRNLIMMSWCDWPMFLSVTSFVLQNSIDFLNHDAPRVSVRRIFITQLCACSLVNCAADCYCSIDFLAYKYFCRL